MVVVEEVYDTEAAEPVYNCRIGEYHTYFVGQAAWGYAVWAHNRCDTNLIGRIAEQRARDILTSRGWRIVDTLRHGRHGLDMIAQKTMRNGVVRTIVAEVKANGGRLSDLQKLGAAGYAKDVLRRLGKLPNLSPSATRAKELLERMILNKEPIRGVVIRVD